MAIIDVPTSSVALAVSQVAKEKDKIMLNACATATELTDGAVQPQHDRLEFRHLREGRTRPAARW